MDGPDEDEDEMNEEGVGSRSMSCLQNGHDLLVRNHLKRTRTTLSKLNSTFPSAEKKNVVPVRAIRVKVVITREEANVLAWLIVRQTDSTAAAQ